jgi:subtilisin family serine protease
VLCTLLLAGVAALPAAVRPADRPIPESFIVLLRSDAGTQSIGAPRTTAELAGDLSGFYGGRTERIYTAALQGFVFHGSAAAAENLARDARVAYVAQDGLVEVAAVQTPAPSWGLDRIDQRGADLDTEYAYFADGAGVDLYVVDTGIRSTHQDFGGRVDTVNAFTAIDDGWGSEDCHGHGTHVAGIAGASTFGVAKGVTIHPVRVVGCDGLGSLSNTIAGIDWITARHLAPGAPRAVVNISLNNGFSFPLEEAVSRSIAAGLVYVVAAGNDGVDASCYLSPQRLPEVITVGASDESGARWAASNYGPCLDLFAPGTGIVSTFFRDDADVLAMTGTSMSAPHVAGTAALLLAGDPEATPAEVQARIVDAATVDAVLDIGEGSPNRLLFSTFAGGGGGAPEPVFSDGFASGDLSAWIGDTP